MGLVLNKIQTNLLFNILVYLCGIPRLFNYISLLNYLCILNYIRNYGSVILRSNIINNKCVVPIL